MAKHSHKQRHIRRRPRPVKAPNCPLDTRSTQVTSTTPSSSPNIRSAPSSPATSAPCARLSPICPSSEFSLPASPSALELVRRRIFELEGGSYATEDPTLHVPTAVRPTGAEIKNGSQFIFKTLNYTPEGLVPTTTLMDTGGSSSCFVNASYAQRNHLITVPLTKPRPLLLGDGEARLQLTHMALVHSRLGNHYDSQWAHVMNMEGLDVIYGLPWIKHHSPTVLPGWEGLRFDSEHCMHVCNGQSPPVDIYCEESTKKSRTGTVDSRKNSKDIQMVSADAFCKLATRGGNSIAVLTPKDLEDLEYPESHDRYRMVEEMTSRLSVITQEDYEHFFEKLRKEPISHDELRKKLPAFLHSLLYVFDPREANKLPPVRPGVDHTIRFIEGKKPPTAKIYGLSRDQARAVFEYIKEMRGKEFIRPSSSPYASPVLCVKKPGGGIRVCVDYRGLNEATVRNRNAPPLISETLSRLSKARVYTKLDVIAAFNDIRIREGDEEKTAFQTRWGLFEYVVMPFGLCNAPATFQSYINSVLHDYLDVFCTAYLDDVLIFSEDLEEHEEHVRRVVERLGKAGLYLDINKCQFGVKEVKYLGLIVSTEGIKMDPAKVNAIQEWRVPHSVKDVQSFLGFANFYRRFIAGYSAIAAPLTNLTKGDPKDKQFPFAPGSRELEAFETLKSSFMTAPVLQHFDPDKETWVETDASDYVVAAVLSQKDTQGILRPVAFLSRKMSPQECNYEIYDKELLAIVRAFEEWEPELAGVDDPIKVLSDHKNLEYFMTSKRLNRRQARWAEFLSEFNFKIQYRPGNQGTKPDALTRRSQDLPRGATDARNQYQVQTVLKTHNLGHGVRHAVSLANLLITGEASLSHLAALLYAMDEESPSSDTTASSQFDPAELMIDLREIASNDEAYQQIVQAIHKNESRLPRSLVTKHGFRIQLGSCEIQDDLVLVNNRLLVPNDTNLRCRILQAYHENPVSGHAGRGTTYDRIHAQFYWPNMSSDIATYCRACVHCKRCKHYREGKHGLLRPLPVPDQYWSDISVDFITPLPDCKVYGTTYKHIMVVVDRLSKRRRFVPLPSLEVQDVVTAFLQHIWSQEGYPRTIVSDRGAQFVNHFWQRLCQRLGTKPKLSTAFHPETDGQTEIVNQLLKQYLRTYINYEQDNWVGLLPLAEFEANSAVNESTGLAPFVATKGYAPRSGLEPERPWEDPRLPANTPSARSNIHAADRFIEKMDANRKWLRLQLQLSQALYAEQANRHRMPAPKLHVGDKVMLDRRFIDMKRPSSSLDYKNLGPFRIKRVIKDSAYELDLPDSMRGVYPVFHAWLLHPLPDKGYPGQEQQPPGPIETDGHEEWAATAVADSRIDRRKLDPATGTRGLLEYKVLYEGHDDYNQAPQWQPYGDLEHMPYLVADFHHAYPMKPGPHPSFQRPSDWSPEPTVARMLSSVRIEDDTLLGRGGSVTDPCRLSSSCTVSSCVT